MQRSLLPAVGVLGLVVWCCVWLRGGGAVSPSPQARTAPSTPPSLAASGDLYSAAPAVEAPPPERRAPRPPRYAPTASALYEELARALRPELYDGPARPHGTLEGARAMHAVVLEVAQLLLRTAPLELVTANVSTPGPAVRSFVALLRAMPRPRDGATLQRCAVLAARAREALRVDDPLLSESDDDLLALDLLRGHLDAALELLPVLQRIVAARPGEAFPVDLVEDSSLSWRTPEWALADTVAELLRSYREPILSRGRRARWLERASRRGALFFERVSALTPPPA